MKRLIVTLFLIIALLMGCKKKITEPPPSQETPSSPKVPPPKFNISFETPDTAGSPGEADQFISMAADYSNSIISILNSISDSMSFDFSNPPSPQVQSFNTTDRVVITWDTLGVTFKLVIVTEPGIVRETLYVNGTSQIEGITFNNFILVDVSVNYEIVGSDTFGNGMFNFYMVRDSMDKNWDNQDPQFNLFWTFYVARDTVDYLMALDTFYLKGELDHDLDFTILNVFGANHPNNYVHVGFAFLNSILYHIKNYYSDNYYDELDYVYNPATGVPTKVSMPHNPYEVIPKLRKLQNLVRNNIKHFSIYEGWYYGLRFEINPLYEASPDTARIYWDDPNDNESPSSIPTYPRGPFAVPPFDVLIEW